MGIWSGTIDFHKEIKNLLDAILNRICLPFQMRGMMALTCRCLPKRRTVWLKVNLWLPKH